ncbi:hypothetical protein HPC49_14135 [Pyxidicoccus fallax]|uniref:Hyalin repeat protein n=1 Tax=Pyxidicoccus fallax TaxID=394095 RepID=A0A848LKC2_9BACT|nr:ELWxxDGT repeat protein [Pyxidicoccus fallax]NMO18156.1 hypothetical protein [Pyxidicoccus fallax]NPC79373.1 hypothetical protein [Pyxidicoccus fallax]
MRCWRSLCVVLALMAGRGEAAPGGSTVENEAAAGASTPWKPCGTKAVPLGPALPNVDPESRDLVHGGDLLFFFTGTDDAGGALWASSGTQGEGTFKVRDFPTPPTGMAPTQFTRVGNRVFFAAEDEDHGRELWVSDGTAAGTKMVVDLWPGPNGSFPRSLFEHQGRLYFTAGDENHGRELRVTDGTAEGTVLVADLDPGPEGAEPDLLTRSGDGSLYFIAHFQAIFTALMRLDPVSGTVTELLRVPSEGSILGAPTAVGSRVFFIIGDLHGHSLELMVTSGGPPAKVADVTHVGERVSMGGKLYFTATRAPDGMDLELWRSDGTAKGTRRVKDVRSGAEGSEPASLTVLGRRLFFSADDGVHGNELWVSDGTEAGTQLFKELEHGPRGAWPSELTVLQGNLFFRAETLERGLEPWMSNGTPGGTVPLEELVTGPNGSYPRSFVRSGWDAFFTAEDGTGVRRLWALPLRPDGRCPSPRR